MIFESNGDGHENRVQEANRLIVLKPKPSVKRVL